MRTSPQDINVKMFFLSEKLSLFRFLNASSLYHKDFMLFIILNIDQLGQGGETGSRWVER